MVGEPVFHPPPIGQHLLTSVNAVINAAYTSWLARSVTVLLGAYEFVSVNFVPRALARYLTCVCQANLPYCLLIRSALTFCVLGVLANQSQATPDETTIPAQILDAIDQNTP
jgi:hypothetical protein